MGDDFNKDLARYVKSRDNDNATRVILNELAKALVKDRENFIEVMRSADLSVLNDATDIQLINGFIENAPTNKKLLLGASFLINHRNQTTGVDGDSEVSDYGVKATYKELDDYFNCCGEQHSNVVATMVAGALKGGVDLANKITDKKNASSNALAQQTTARKEMIQSVIAQRQKEAENKTKEGGKTKRTLLIVGGVSLALIIGFGIYFALKKK